MQWTRTKLLILFSIFALIIVGAYFAYDWQTLTIDTALSDNAYDILLKYIFIILVCERGVTVYNAINFEGRKIAIERRIKYFREKIKNYKKLDVKLKTAYQDDDPLFKSMMADRPTNTPDINYLNLIELEEQKMEQVSDETRNFSMRVLMIAGVILSIGGLSVLNDLIGYKDSWEASTPLFQQRLIKFFDILLTGALIGGGSKSFHEFLSTIKDVMRRVKGGSQEAE